MLRRIAPACLLMTALVAGAIPPTAAMMMDSYVADWEGQPFLEAVDPLKRFVHYPVSDPDGNGFVDLNPIVYDDAVPVPMGLVGVTNAAIEAQLVELGLTRADVAAQFDMLLTPIPELHDERDAAILDTLEGDFLQVNAGLTGTALDITYYCGRSSGPGEHEWVIGLPLPADCPGSGGIANDIMFFSTATRVEVFGQEFDDLDLKIVIKSLNSAYNDPYLGIQYGSHTVGTETNPDKEIRGDLKLSNIRNGPVGVDAQLTITTGQWLAGDTLTYTFGGGPFNGKTVWLDFGRTTTAFGLTATVAIGSNFSIKVNLSPVSALAQLRADIDIPGGAGRNVALGAKGFPSSFKIAVQKRSVSGGTQGDWHWIDLEHGNGVSSMQDLEIQGTFSDWAGSHFSFQLAGFPAKNRLRVSLGNGAQGCDSLGVFSIDLSKRFSTTSGRYRAIVVDGQKCDKEISLTASNLHRMNLVLSKDDRWDSDNDAMFSNGGSIAVAGDSKVDVYVTIPWLPDYESQLRNNPWGYTWMDRVGLSQSSGFGPDPGQALVVDHLVAVNSYFWHIADNQLDSELSCMFVYPAPDNRCA